MLRLLRHTQTHTHTHTCRERERERERDATTTVDARNLPYMSHTQIICPLYVPHMSLICPSYVPYMSHTQMLLQAGATVDAIERERERERERDRFIRNKKPPRPNSTYMSLICPLYVPCPHLPLYVLHLSLICPTHAHTQMLLQAGATVDARNLQGQTPLHAAAASDQPALVGLSLSRARARPTSPLLSV